MGDLTMDATSEWAAGMPSAGGEYDADAAALSRFVRAGQDLLAASGDPKRRRTVARVSEQARTSFLRSHVERLYGDLTDGFRRHLRLEELAYAAADRHPELVPDRARMAAEQDNRQPLKDGLEVQQGTFFAHVLRAPRPGRHLVRSLRRATPAARAALDGFRRTGFADLGQVTVRRSDQAAYLTLCNERYLNAEDDETVAALEAAVDLALLDDETRVGVLRGAPMTHPRYSGQRVFSAGINLTHLYDGRISLIGFLLTRELGYLSKIYRGLETDETSAGGSSAGIQKPWIAMVDGFAIGGGAQQLLLFDRVIAADGAFFSLPALNEGLVPGAANMRLTRFLGARLARQLAFWDKRIHTHEPESRLLCDEVVAPERMDAAARAAVDRLAIPAVVANRHMMHLGEEPEDAFREYMAEYALEQSRRLYSQDLMDNLQRTWVSRRRPAVGA
jgi:thioesterase DpgC